MAPRNYVLEGIERREREARARLVAERDRYRDALEKIAGINLPWRDTARLAQHTARQALATNQEGRDDG